MHDSFLTQTIFCSVPHNHLRELTLRQFEHEFYIVGFITFVLCSLNDLFTILHILTNRISPTIVMPFFILNTLLIFLYKSLVCCSIFLLRMVHFFTFSMGCQDVLFELFVSLCSVVFEILCQIGLLYSIHLESRNTSTQQKCDQKCESRFLYRAHNYNVSNCAMIHHQID